MSKQTLTKKISTLTKSEENFQKKFLKHSQDTLDQGILLKGVDIRSLVMKFMFSKKATKIEKNLHRRFDTYYIMSKRM